MKKKRFTNITRPVPPVNPPAGSKRHGRGKALIRFRTILHLAFKNLFYKRLRTTLTILGVVIGIGAVVFLLALGYGLQDLVKREVVGSKSVTTIDVTSPRSKVLKLNTDGVKELSALGSVEQVGRVYNAAAKVKLNNSQAAVVLYGADQPYLDLAQLNVTEGKLISSFAADQAMVNTSLLDAIGLQKHSDAIGQKIEINFETTDPRTDQKRTIQKTLNVTGVIDSGNGVEVFTGSQLFEAEGINDASQVKMLVTDRNFVPQVRREIESLGYSTTSPLDTLEQIDQIFRLLQFVLIGFGGIGMIIAVLGMFNTLTIALLERTREIGLMITMGAQQKDIGRLFVIEALLLSVIGGVAGLASAATLALVTNIFLTGFARSRGVEGMISVFTITPWLAIGTVVLSAILGLIVVYFPARRASRINPMDAIRFE